MTELEHRLRELRVAFPETPDVVSGALGRLAPEPSRGRLGRRQLAVAVALVLAVLAGIGALSPGARAAFLELFGIRGAQVVRVDVLPDPARYDPLSLGERVTLARADAATSFRIALPDGPPPRDVYLDRAVPGGAVTVVLDEGDGVLLTQMFGTIGPLVEKLVRVGTTVERRSVDGAPALWVEGAHVVFFQSLDGDVRPLRARVAGNTLLWEADGVLHRLEGAFDRERALEIARAVED